MTDALLGLRLSHPITGVILVLCLGACGSPDSKGWPQGGQPDGMPSEGPTAMTGPAPTTSAPSAPGTSDPAGPGSSPTAAPQDPGSAGCATFDTSFEAIQKMIFEGRGCTNDTCHGQSAVGGLDLRADVAWQNLVDAPSNNSSHLRVSPGTATESFLYQKLAAGADPDNIEVQGSPMPVGTAPLTENELEAVRLWITKGAPRTGVVEDELKGTDVGKLLGACLPPSGPVKAKPLDPPAPDEGFQFVLPTYTLDAASEVEQCIPFAYDFSDIVPPQHKDEARNVVYVNGSQVRQDPQSHHLVLWNPREALPTTKSTDQKWTCRSGENIGQSCDPTRGSRDCGTGLCAGEVVKGSFCSPELDTTTFTQATDPFELLLSALTLGVGILSGGGMPSQIANAQAPQQHLPPLDGVYSELPLSGILWFNSHAFNLSVQPTDLEGRVNFYYPERRERQMVPMNVIDNLNIATGLAPFEKETFCAKHVVPMGFSIAMLTGHTHRRGERFWVTDHTGDMIYENFTYNDPEYLRFEPFREFNAWDEPSRTLEYCATFNNGLKEDGSPDLDLVTRASRMPEATECTPVACVAGKVTEACSTDGDCDSTPGAGDGDCDACAITTGVTTENEMFVLMPWYVLPAPLWGP